MENLITILTQDQINAAKEGKIVWLSNAAQRKQVESLGYQVIKEDRLNSRLHHIVSDKLSAYLNKHGNAVHVVAIVDKYNDSVGAFEVAYLCDYNGFAFTVSNAYDTSICFRTMTTTQILAYANEVG